MRRKFWIAGGALAVVGVVGMIAPRLSAGRRRASGTIVPAKRFRADGGGATIIGDSTATQTGIECRQWRQCGCRGAARAAPPSASRVRPMPLRASAADAACGACGAERLRRALLRMPLRRARLPTLPPAHAAERRRARRPTPRRGAADAATRAAADAADARELPTLPPAHAADAADAARAARCGLRRSPRRCGRFARAADAAMPRVPLRTLPSALQLRMLPRARLRRCERVQLRTLPTRAAADAATRAAADAATLRLRTASPANARSDFAHFTECVDARASSPQRGTRPSRFALQSGHIDSVRGDRA